MLQFMNLKHADMKLGISVIMVNVLQSIQKTIKRKILKKKNNSDKFIYDRLN